MTRLSIIGSVALGAAMLAGCDGGASAVPRREAARVAPPAAILTSAPGPAETPSVREASSKSSARPIWSSSRRYTAEENARRNFERNGAAFGAASVADYAAKARAFVDRPPRGAQVVTRANGDRLIYDPAANVFAVATKDGAPRTMFRPDDGAAYWEKVKAREAARTSGDRRRG